MYTKESFLAACKLEAKILKHLAAQATPAQLGYRPTPGQRSTLELLQYLSYSPLASVIYAATGTWDHYDGLAAAGKDLTLAGFPKAIDKQAAAIAKHLKPLSDATLRRKQTTHWNGQKMTLGEALVALVLQHLTAYRFQLFLYLKASGSSQLGTSDAWMGKAKKPEKAKKARAEKA
jgi:hypothetical protein